MGGKSSREEPPKPEEAPKRTSHTASSNSFTESSLTNTGAVCEEIYEVPGTASSEFVNQQKLLLDYYKQNKIKLEQEERQQKLLTEHRQKLKEVRDQQKQLREQHRQKLLEEENKQKLLEQQHKQKQLLLEQQQQKFVEEQRQQKLLEEEHQKKQLEEYQQKLLTEHRQKVKEVRNQQKQLREQHRQKLLEEEHEQKLVGQQHKQEQLLLEQQQQQKFVEEQCLEAFSEEEHSKKNPLGKELQGQIPKEWQQEKCMKAIMKLYNLAEAQAKCLAPVNNRQMSHCVLRDSLTRNWSSMPPNKTFIRITVKEDTDEFRTVKNCFKATTQKRFDVVRIERVQNPFTLGCYILKKLEMNSMFGSHNVIEKIVFRGTLSRNIDKICNDNFNWRLCADSKGNTYGRGVSFSPISYFASYYADQKATTKAMFLVRVLTSKIIEGNINMEIPPHVESDNNVLRFDTTKRIDGKIIVKYSDSDFYPEYVIYYTVGPEPEKKKCQHKEPSDDCTVQDG